MPKSVPMSDVEVSHDSNGPDWLTKPIFVHSQGLICIISVITRIADKKFTDPCVVMETTLQQPWELLSLGFRDRVWLFPGD